MNTSDLPQCHGLFGNLFGHKYRARYSTKSVPHFGSAQAEIAKRQDLKEIIAEAKRDISDDSEIVEALDRILTDAVHKEEERVYQGDICVRCGHVVARPVAP